MKPKIVNMKEKKEETKPVQVKTGKEKENRRKEGQTFIHTIQKRNLGFETYLLQEKRGWIFGKCKGTQMKPLLIN